MIPYICQKILSPFIINVYVYMNRYVKINEMTVLYAICEITHYIINAIIFNQSVIC